MVWYFFLQWHDVDTKVFITVDIARFVCLPQQISVVVSAVASLTTQSIFILPTDQSEAYYFSRGRTNTWTQAPTELRCVVWHWVTFVIQVKGSRISEWLKGAPRLCFFQLAFGFWRFVSAATTTRQIDNIQHVLQLSYFFFPFLLEGVFICTKLTFHNKVKREKSEGEESSSGHRGGEL